jgi:Arc/MetJ-type ribon-helix-helix transcriptional regulator
MTTEKERTVSLSVSVPQTLKARIDALRQAGNGFNVSEFVTVVLLKKIDREEELARIQKPLVAKLRREKYSNAENLEQMGREEAQRDVESMSLAEFMAVDALNVNDPAEIEAITQCDAGGAPVILGGGTAVMALNRHHITADSQRLTFLRAYFQELKTIWSEIKNEVYP